MMVLALSLLVTVEKKATMIITMTIVLAPVVVVMGIVVKVVVSILKNAKGRKQRIKEI